MRSDKEVTCWGEGEDRGWVNMGEGRVGCEVR